MNKYIAKTNPRGFRIPDDIYFRFKDNCEKQNKTATEVLVELMIKWNEESDNEENNEIWLIEDAKENSFDRTKTNNSELLTIEAILNSSISEIADLKKEELSEVLSKINLMERKITLIKSIICLAQNES